MVNPKIIEETPISLAEVKASLEAASERDGELNFLSNKTKEYLENFNVASSEEAEELKNKLKGLDLTRIKDEHIAKLIDFHPKNLEELRAVLQAYPLSLPKKDQEAILKVLN